MSTAGSVAPSVTWADDAKYDELMDLGLEEDAKEKYRLERENEQFPDEVDTPENMPARLRFARLDLLTIIYWVCLLFLIVSITHNESLSFLILIIL